MIFCMLTWCVLAGFRIFQCFPPFLRLTLTPTAHSLTLRAVRIYVRSVPLFRAFFAWLLVALWVPAKAHCEISTMAGGLMAKVCAEQCEHSVALEGDSCAIVEGGDFFSNASNAAAPLPSLTVLAGLSCWHAELLALAQPLAPPVWAADHPRDWVPVWAFVQRAAPLSRAPSLVG